MSILPLNAKWGTNKVKYIYDPYCVNNISYPGIKVLHLTINQKILPVSKNDIHYFPNNFEFIFVINLKNNFKVSSSSLSRDNVFSWVKHPDIDSFFFFSK